MTDESSGSAEPVTDEGGISGSAGGEAPPPAPKRVRLLLTIAGGVIGLGLMGVPYFYVVALVAAVGKSRERRAVAAAIETLAAWPRTAASWPTAAAEPQS